MIWGHPPKIIRIKSNNQTNRRIQNLLIAQKETLHAFNIDPDLSCLELLDRMQ